MTRMTLALLLATACGLGFPSDVSAQAFLDARFTISFGSTSPAVLFSRVARLKMVGLEAAVDPSLQRSITITLEDVTVRTFLNAACDSIGCRWRVEGHTLVVEALPPDPSRGGSWIPPTGAAMPEGSQFVNTPVGTMLDVIGRVVGEGGSYEVDAVSANQLVTVDVSSQDALRAIATVVRAAGLKPGTPYTVTVRRRGQKPTIINTVLPKVPDTEELR